jgi:NAD(P)-dependent dehydrogenase (short-subunit alcohol dehydrogenase family)
MSELRFDGRVAIVTGAGRGIGRAYARLLAARGAQVVVNDLGGSMGGEGEDDGPASEVVAEIADAGGQAAADTHDVSTADGAQALVEGAVERFGRLDVLINNAGIMRWARFPDVSDADFEAHVAVHLLGSFHTARAAWPHLAEGGDGRIVNTTSAGMFGLADNTSYAAAKGGCVGLTRSLAVAGSKVGIRANLIAPAAMTRMAGVETDDDAGMPPDLVAPMVAYLAHVDCPVTGEIYAAGAGRFARIFIGATDGYLAGPDATIEDVVAHWDQINDRSSYSVPAGLMDWSTRFTAHLRGPEA